MATLTPAPLGYGVAPTYTTLTASDTIPVQGTGRYLLITKNTTGTALTTVIEDPNSSVPPGSAASATFADVSVTTPITTGERHTLIDAGRHRDAATGLVTLTNTNAAAGTTGTVVGPF